MDTVVNTSRKELWVRVLQNGCSENGRQARIEVSLAPSLDSLQVTVAAEGGEVHFWGGNNYLDVSPPCQFLDGHDSREAKHLLRDERFQVLLERGP